MIEARRTWKVRSLHSDHEWEGSLEAVWEVSADPISDNYSPHETSANELLDLWIEDVQGKFANDLIPIYWFVQCTSQRKFESMPFQFKRHPFALEDFLTFYTWPVDSVTGESLNWCTLPVVDKLWSKRGSKGGFIQEATGWKPSILQPYIHLPALTRCKRLNGVAL